MIENIKVSIYVVGVALRTLREVLINASADAEAAPRYFTTFTIDRHLFCEFDRYLQ